MALPADVVDGGEIILLAIKPSMWRPVFDSAACLIACTVLAAAASWAARPLPGLSLTATIQLILLIAVTRLGIAIIRWVPTWHVLTNRRIINIRGVRAPRVSSCPLVKIRSTSVNASPAERVTNLGTISFETVSDDNSPGPWQSIARAQDVETRIRRAIHDANMP